jgi:hypothetical protein
VIWRCLGALLSWTVLGLALTAALVAGKARSATRLHTPALSAPADDARVGSVSAFSWSSAKGAAKYEFQLSADEDFGSVVLGQGRGSFQTMNTFATIDKALANGAYHWRVRAIDRRDDAGPWSPTRSLTVSWTDRPTLLAPAPSEG